MIINARIVAQAPTAKTANTAGTHDSIDTAHVDELFPSYVDFSRYPTPLSCASAARNARDAATRTYAVHMGRVLTFGAPPEGDTVGRYVAQIARACGARFSVATTAPNAMAELVDLALMAQNDTLALAAVRAGMAYAMAQDAALHADPNYDATNRRAIADLVAAGYNPGPVPTPFDKFAAQVFGAVAAMIPAPVSFLDAFAVELEGAKWSHHTYWAMVAHALALLDASRTIDRVRIPREAQQILALSRRLGGDSTFHVGDYVVNNPVVGVQPQFGYDPGNSVLVPESMRRLAYEKLGLLARLMAPSDSIRVASREKPPRAILQVDHWLPAPPPRGHVTVVITGNVGNTPLDECFAPSWWHVSTCVTWPQTRIADWQHRYGARGLSVVLIDFTKGSFGTVPLDLAQEAARRRWFWQDHVGVPVTMGIVDRAVDVLSAPDNRVDVYPDTTHAGIYPLTLLGSNGEMLYQGYASPDFEAFLAKAMGDTTAQSSVPSHPRGSQ